MNTTTNQKLDLPRSLKLAAQATDVYRRIFAAGIAAPLLSHPNPVRYNGFDMTLNIAAVHQECDDVVGIILTARDDSALPSWIPGAHLDVFLPSGKQRQYSLCGDPDDPLSYRIAVRRISDGGGGSLEVHEQLRQGMNLRVRGPRNAFPLIAAPSYLFVAGGIGITPVLPMIRRAQKRGIPWHIYYLGRSRATMPFCGELESYPDGHVTVRPDDTFGSPDIESIIRSADRGAAVYICGPAAMTNTARIVMQSANPTGSLHSEQFTPLPVANGLGFRVHLARSGITVDVGGDETVLTAIRRVAPGVSYSCQQGFCGTCKVRVLSGTIDHRDTLLTDTERTDTMLICRSRSAGDTLVMDL